MISILQLLLSLSLLLSPPLLVGAVATSAGTDQYDQHEAAHHPVVPRAVEHSLLENGAVVDETVATAPENEKEWMNVRQKRQLRSQIVSFGSSAAARVTSSINSRSRSSNGLNQPQSPLSPTFNSRFFDEMNTAAVSGEHLLPTRLVGVDLNEVVDEAVEKVNKRFNHLEANIYKNNAMRLTPNSMGWFMGASSYRSAEQAKNLSRAALVAEEATRTLVRQHKLNLDQIVFGLTRLDISGTALSRECPKSRESQSLSCYPGRYRSFSGHCNNVERPDLGAANGAFARSLAPRYADGVSAPRRSITGAELPSPRDVSLAIHQNHEDSGPHYSHMTTVTTYFGQLVFHDLAQAAVTTGYKGQRIRCCGLASKNKKNSPADLHHPECFPIKVEKEKDPFMSRLHQECIEYVRSSPAVRRQCGLGSREQINQVSSFLDGSVLYGSSKEAANALRTFSGGQLKAIQLSKRAKEMLPMQDEGEDQDCKMSSGKNGKRRCFKSGDDRVNENLGLVIMHTLFLREHNRIARQLSALNPHWTDGQLYEEARKIVGALLQKITYGEFLPYVIGEQALDHYELRLLTDGFYSGYDMGVDPSVDSAAAAAVFAFLFTMTPPTMERYSTKELHMLGAIRTLKDSYFNPSEVFPSSSSTASKFDQYLMGMISQSGRMNTDATVSDEMTNNGLDEDEDDGGILPKNKKATQEGFDFVAVTLQRGRDHGLPGYTEYRRACQIEPEVNRWEDLASVVKGDLLKRLKTLYKDVRDIDLFTGGLVEQPMIGALVGPTFACLLARQFTFLRKGDRFWFENDLPPSSFSPAQLTELRKASLARLLCDNGDQTDFVQPQAMVSSDVYLNAFQYCNTAVIPRVDLSPWQESPFGTLHTNLSLLIKSGQLVGGELRRARRSAEELFELEEQLKANNVKNNHQLTPSQLMHYKTTRAKRQALAISNQSVVLEAATRGILNHLRGGRDREHLASGNALTEDVTELLAALPKIHLEEYLQNKELTAGLMAAADACDDRLLPCDHTSSYRTITGWCNNLKHPHFGKSMAVFERFSERPAYDDGVGVPRRFSVVKRRLLPSARLVSTNVHGDISSPHLRYSLATMQWGQFLDHDLTFTPMYMTSSGQLLDCKQCSSRKTVHPECWPISVPSGDPFFRTQQCLHFVRSMNAQRTLGPREQMNQLTSYLDASNVYGSENCEAARLRLNQGGKLNFTRHPIRGLKDLLPQISDHPECKAPSKYCFLAGDLRASEQPSLAAMHTIFMREHNRIAERLAALNSHWTDEKLYQTARKIVGAEMQHITYGEFLPRLLGMDIMDRFGLSLLGSGYYEDYDGDCSAMIRNEFAAAVYRLGHTLLKPSFERLDANYQTAKRPLMLREAFFNSDMLYAPGAIDELLRGIVTSSIETFDSSITEEVTNHLFEEARKPFSGMDLIALNLQRGRDHGLQPYNYYREMCNLTRARRWEDLSGEMAPETIAKLRNVYEHVDDVDLFSGGISERSLHGALVGPTVGCLLGMQFRALRRCDRFWYEGGTDRFTRFTEQQLAELRKVKLAKVICINGDAIGSIQKHALDLPDQFVNPRIPCSSLPQMDLSKWRDYDRSCMMDKSSGNGKAVVIAQGRSRRLSPCVNCVCTLEGPLCRSVRVTDCRALSAAFSREEILADQACVVQCAFALHNNHLQVTSMRTLMTMLGLVQ